jgi:hypothetical protein
MAELETREFASEVSRLVRDQELHALALRLAHVLGALTSLVPERITVDPIKLAIVVEELQELRAFVFALLALGDEYPERLAGHLREESRRLVPWTDG